MRCFVGIDLGREPVPDETTVCRFRHLLEAHDLGRRLFDEVQRHLAAKGLKVATGTIVDATIINAPSSTKNADKARDPGDASDKKRNQWYFGMKGHFGVDSRSKLIHAVPLLADGVHLLLMAVVSVLLLAERQTPAQPARWSLALPKLASVCIVEACSSAQLAYGSSRSDDRLFSGSTQTTATGGTGR
jgi:hypothetical protein